MAPLRSRLDADMIGMCQVLRSWLRAGVIDDLDVSLLPVENLSGDGKLENVSWIARAFEETGGRGRVAIGEPGGERQLVDIQLNLTPN
jgi:hypothetical protein